MDRVGPGAAAAALVAVAVAACGGGGGRDDGAWLTFTPAAPSVTVDEGTTTTFDVVATSSRDVTEPFSVLVEDRSGKLLPTISVVALSQTQFRATFTTSPALTAGTHTGRIQVHLCADDPRTCARPLEGSPWTVGYTIAVRAFDLHPLDPIPGVADWTGSGRDATGNRYVPASLGPSAFTRRFRQNVDPLTFGCTRDLSGLVTADPLVFVALGFPWDNGNLCTGGGGLVVAYDERTGEQRWAHDFGPAALDTTLYGPATGADAVFAVANGRLWALEQATGAVRWSVAPPTGFTFAPAAVTAEGSAVYAALASGGTGGGYARFAASDGALAWAVATADRTRPVVADGLLYALDAAGSSVVALNVDDGTPAWSVPVSGAQASVGHLGFIALGPTLVCERLGGACVDPTTRAAASFGPVVRHRFLAASDGEQVLEWTGSSPPIPLALRDLASGDLAPGWQAFRMSGDTCVGILTPTTVFGCTYAFDRATGAPVALPLATAQQLLAISARGVGYFWSRPTLTAVNLR